MQREERKDRGLVSYLSLARDAELANESTETLYNVIDATYYQMSETKNRSREPNSKPSITVLANERMHSN